MDAAVALRRSRFPYLNAALFAATAVTTVWAGAQMGELPPAGGALARVVLGGLPFAAAILGILVCHEMGHYLMGKAYGVDSTLPFFIPVPFGFGTFGAVIRIRSPMPTRRAVIDIGAAGPIAGFAVALPLLAWGLAHSEIRAVGEAAAATSNVGSPYAILRALWLHQELRGGGGLQLMGDSLVTWGMARLVVGPIAPGFDVFLHPVALAAWLGLFVTTLNLIPLGQLDGGHVTYALLGRQGALRLSRLVSLGLLGFGLFASWNWLVWWLITRFAVGLRHPPALQEEPLGPGRKLLAAAALLLFLATFIPVPIAV
ncbi:MAG TPA: site-2 protease family protein [Anaeromyxobacteraceae bacterium]|jgi:membrane-associated protease RseP (regulator of RpoE activity)|nr:site-2 protease family protein [Anaeromyxobacteraceae bacterium]